MVKLKKRNRLILFFVIIYVIIFTTTYFTSSTKRNSKLEVIPIGVMSPSDELNLKYEFISHLAQENLNQYCNESGINIRFNFINSNAKGDPKKAVEAIKKFKEDGVNLIVGLGWNTQLNASYNYLTENNMIVVSPSSTSPIFAKSDTCFRLLPDDEKEVKAIADAIINYGINTIIILQRNCTWGKNFADTFFYEYRVKGGEVVDRISYTPDSTQAINESIERAARAVYDARKLRGDDRVGVLLFALDEASDVLMSAEKSSDLMNVTWFCTETNTLDKIIRQKAGYIASKVSLIGPYNTHIYNEDYLEINRLYIKEFDEPLDFVLANVYDGCWLLALSVIEANSHSTLDVSSVFGEVAYNHYGITGPLDINCNGDRSWIRYYFYGYYEINGNIIYLRTGEYVRLEKNDKEGSSISHSPYDVDYDNFPYYVWDKRYESK